MKKLIILFIPMVFSACKGNNHTADAWGNFEATEIMVPARNGGILEKLDVKEGQVLQGGEILGLTDTLALHLQRLQLYAQRKAILSGLKNIEAEVKVLEKQLEVLHTEKQRVMNMLRDGAATGKQLDDINSRLEVLELQVRAIQTKEENIIAEARVMDTRMAQLDDQVSRSLIISPAAGTVLEKYAEEKEMVSPGRPLFKLADLETMVLRAYISATRLDDIRLGQEVKVMIDSDRTGYHAYPGRLVWISPKAEFTPKIIQTKEERVTLVYAIRVEVKNDGRIKIGMPGEVYF